MSAASRRRRQWAISFRHLAKIGRPIYRRRKLVSVSEAIQKEHNQAQRLAKIKRKK